MKRHLAIRIGGEGGPVEGEALFDVENDPVESKNLIDDPSVGEVVEEMRGKVRRFRVETKDPWVLASRQGGEEGLGQ